MTFQEAQGDMWKAAISRKPAALVITTNGFTKSNGEAVMGRGCAREAALANPDLPRMLGMYLDRYGNHVTSLAEHTLSLSQESGEASTVLIVTFPVKPISAKCSASKDNVVRHMRDRFNPGQAVPGWACVADLEIIEQSCRELVKFTDDFIGKASPGQVFMPRPGCGAGELSWEDVKVILQRYLDERFVVFHK